MSNIFSSDLQRALKTAEAIRLAQLDPPELVCQLQVLREQDFGFYEGKQFYERPKGADKHGRRAHREEHLNTKGFRDVESKLSMIARVEAFLDEHFVPLLPFVADDETVAVVAHGIILTYLWRSILARFRPGNVSVNAGAMVGGAGMGLEYLGGWSNTGYLDLEIKSKVNVLESLDSVDSKSSNPKDHGVVSGPAASAPASTSPQADSSSVSSLSNSSTKQSVASFAVPIAAEAPHLIMPDGSASITQAPIPAFDLASSTIPASKGLDFALAVRAVNSQDHLTGLKKTRGGIGNLRHDEKQKTVDSYFKRQKLG